MQSRAFGCCFSGQLRRTIDLKQITNVEAGPITFAERITSKTGRNVREFCPPAGKSILIAEEDASLANFLSRELQAGSFTVDVVHDGETALQALQGDCRYDLLITELNLPRLDGMSLLQRVRPAKPRMPMMVLSTRVRVDDKVKAFQNGADDYVAKPFSYSELNARVHALLRRHSGLTSNMSSVGGLTLHREERRVERNGRRIDLTPREFAILEFMMRNIGRPVSRATLSEEVWNTPYDPSTNIVDVYMKYVRDKIDRPGESKLMHTVRGIGYELRES